MYEKILSGIFLIIFIINGCATKKEGWEHLEEWKLIWAEEFDGPEIDWNVWSKTPRGSSNWNDTMSDAEELYEIRDGKLILRGINNTGYPDDPSPYLTGGIWGKDRQRFKMGRIDVRARFDSAQGFWPAIWLMPVRDASTPDYYAEIDIMEHLNFNNYVYQVVHSTYTLDGNRTDPMNHVRADIDVSGYNVYSAEVYEDSIVFLVNNHRTYAYPRVEDAGRAQFPFPEFDYYVILSAQLGGGWVGEVDPDNLPVELSIDWVRFYQKK